MAEPLPPSRQSCVLCMVGLAVSCITGSHGRRRLLCIPQNSGCANSGDQKALAEAFDRLQSRGACGLQICELWHYVVRVITAWIGLSSSSHHLATCTSDRDQLLYVHVDGIRHRCLSRRVRTGEGLLRLRAFRLLLSASRSRSDPPRAPAVAATHKRATCHERANSRWPGSHGC